MTSERAGWGIRAGAQIIDGLIIVAITFAVMIIVSIAGGDDDAVEIALYATAAVSSMLYSTILLSRQGDNNGQTVGKQAMGIRVVLADAAPITMRVAARREIIGRGLLGIIPLYSIVDILWPLNDAENQALHDKVADTFVVPAEATGVLAATPLATYTSPTPPAPPLAVDDSAPVDEPVPAHEPAPAPQAPNPAPDLGRFAPPVELPDPPEPREDISGPFGPSYDE